MTRRLRRLMICGWLLLLFAARLEALDPHSRITQYGHSVWRVQDGILSSAPTAIVQSKDGYLWIGTETGLLRFDGVRFVPWSFSEIPDPQVTALLAATDGTLWIGTASRFASLKNGKLTIFPIVGHNNAIVEDRQGRIWATFSRSPTRQPLCEVSTGTARCFGAAEGIPFPFGGGMDLDKDGNLLVASASQVVHWSPERGLISSYSFDALKSQENLHGISNVLADTDGASLVSIGFAGTSLGLQRLQDKNLSPYESPGLDGSSIAPELAYRDRTNSLWIGTFSDGLYRITDSTTEHFTTREGLSGDSVRDFREDEEGNLWVATDGGLDCFRDLKVISWGRHEGLPSGFVSSVLAARDGSILIGTHSGLNILRNGHVTTLDASQGLPGNGVTALLEDTAGHYWMGVSNQLAVYDGHNFTVIKRPDGQPIGIVYTLALDSDGSVWATTVSPHPDIVHLRNGKFESSMPTDLSISRLSNDRSSGLWLLDRTRLGHYSNGKLQWFPTKVSLGAPGTLSTSPNGYVLSTSPNGLWSMKDGKVQFLGTANGLPCQSSNGFSFSGDQKLVIRTPCGLLVIAADSLNAWWSNPSRQVPYILIDSYDGARLSYATFSPQMSQAPDGRIWMANEGGIQTLDPGHVATNSLPPPVHIEEVVADRIRLAPKARLELPPLTRDLEINYTALSFSIPQKVSFRYMLEGRDATWQEPGTRRTAFYQDLKPGRYRFHVIAANNDGVWNNLGDNLEFSVRPAWFQTAWFRMFSILSAGLLIWVAFRLRVRSIAAQISARFDERLDERTRMALELHDTFLQTVQGSKMVADDALDPAADKLRMRHALEKLSLWLGQAVTEGRAALHALRVTTTERNHLAEFLDRTAKEQFQRTSTSYALTVIGDAKDVHPIVRDEIARIAEEAIRNASLHSHASQLLIELRYARDLILCFKDNGVGIDPEVVNSGKAGHFGLQGMKDRSARIRATIKITSTLNAGTQIALRVPGDVIYRHDSRSIRAKLRDLTPWSRRRTPEANDVDAE